MKEKVLKIFKFYRMEKNFDPDVIPPEGDISGAKLPSYMRKAPWYFNTGKDELDHLRMTPWAQPKESTLSQFVKSRNRYYRCSNASQSIIGSSPVGLQ